MRLPTEDTGDSSPHGSRITGVRESCADRAAPPPLSVSTSRMACSRLALSEAPPQRGEVVRQAHRPE
jgi:hypothetical protein